VPVAARQLAVECGVCDCSFSHKHCLANLLAIAKEEAPKTFRVIGAELGYRYAGSPVICDETGGPPPNIEEYVPTVYAFAARSKQRRRCGFANSLRRHRGAFLDTRH
jgi:hypothetical protein